MSQPRPLEAEKLLVVDDNPTNLRLLSQILGERGYHLRAVTGGQRALASIAADAPDLILLDIRMPGMDGYAVCRQLKADPRTRDIPVLFISALDEIEDKMAAFSAGGVDYITKPFQLEEVIARVETHLALRRLQRRLQEANRRMERELELAAKVQASFMLRRLPEMPGWQLSAALLPARLTSGDFYDLLHLPGGRVAIVIADVVDKGVGAGLFMALSSALLRAYSLEHPEQPQAVFHAANQRILEYTTISQFVTVFYGVLDPADGTLTYVNAGHLPPLWLEAKKSREPELLLRTGPPLGVLEEAAWQVRQVSLAPGDLLVLYTDGITEAESPDAGFYDRPRLLEAACLNSARSTDEIRDCILESVHTFTGGAPLSDDIALMVVKREKV